MIGHVARRRALVTGLLTGLSLIVVIGAQNAFVLRQGILRRHVGPVVGFCIASDAVLMVLGTLGVGVVVGEQPAVLVAIRVGSSSWWGTPRSRCGVPSSRRC